MNSIQSSDKRRQREVAGGSGKKRKSWDRRPEVGGQRDDYFPCASPKFVLFLFSLPGLKNSPLVSCPRSSLQKKVSKNVAVAVILIESQRAKIAPTV